MGIALQSSLAHLCACGENTIVCNSIIHPSLLCNASISEEIYENKGTASPPNTREQRCKRNFASNK